MNLDIHPYKQSLSNQDRFRYCLNMITENDYYSNIITTEQSNTLINQVKDVLGWTVSDDSLYLFTQDNKISKFTDGKLCTILELECLNFCENIYTQTKKDECGNLEIFFQDGVNPDRYINLGEEYTSCEQLSLSQCLNCTKLEVNISSGGLQSGVYAFTTKDKDLNNFCPITQNYTISNVEKSCDGNLTNSGKSFNITNIPDNHELYVIKTVNGITTTHRINSNYNGEHLEDIDIAEVVSPSITYDSKVSEVFNNKLIRANLSTDNLDYQCKAWDIRVIPYTIKVPADKAYLFPNIKSFMGDELYNLSINFVKCTGERSPAYFLNPQLRDKSFTCGNTYNSVHDIVPKDDPNNWKKCPAKVWELFNTSQVINKPHQETTITDNCGKLDIDYGIWEEFDFGYHESCEDYDFECLDCEAPKRSNFRMPDRCHFESNKEESLALPVSDKENNNVSPLISNNTNPEDNTYIFPLLLRFENIKIPEGYDFYEIRSTKRTDTNKTVIAKGITHHTYGVKFEDGNVYATSALGVNSHEYISYNGNSSPLSEDVDNTLENNNFTGELIGAYTFHSPNTSYNQPTLTPQYVKTNKTLTGAGIFYGSVEDPYKGSRIAYNLYKSEDNCQYLKYEGGGYVRNNVVADAPAGVTYDLFNLYKEKTVYFELCDLLKLSPIQSLARNNDGDNYDLNNTNTLVQADQSFSVTDTDGTSSYHGLKDQTAAQYISNVKSNYVSLKREYCYPLNSAYDNVIVCSNEETSIGQGDSYINYWNYKRSARFSSDLEDNPLSEVLSSIIYFPVESDINTNLDDRDTCNKLIDPSFEEASNYPNTILGGTYESENQIVVDYDEFNYEFSDPCYTVTLQQEFCCIQNLSNRLVWSETEQLNNKNNNWSITLANNYIDIPQDKGPITNIVNFGDELYVHTTDAIFRVYTNQQLEVNDSLIYIGQGNLFSQTPVELFATPEGYAGLRDQQESLKNQFGYFWVDHKACKLHVLKGKQDLKEILGVRNYYKETMSDELFRLGFDPRHNRVFFTQDETLSIEPITGTPISFHSYIPQHYLWDRKNMWTVNKGIYLHNQDCNTLNFYGKDYPHIIESVQTLNYEAFKEHQDYIECNNCEYCCEDTYDYLFYTNHSSSGKCTDVTKSKGLVKVNNIKNVKSDSLHTFKDYRIKEYKEDIDGSESFKDRYVIIRREYQGNNELILLDELPILNRGRS